MARQKMTINRINRSKRIKSIKEDMISILVNENSLTTSQIKERLSSSVTRTSTLTIYEVANVDPIFKIENGRVSTSVTDFADVNFAIAGGNQPSVNFDGAVMQGNNASGAYIYYENNKNILKGYVNDSLLIQWTLTINSIYTYKSGNKAPTPDTKQQSGSGYKNFIVEIN
ncbi:MAG: hypothetical protein R2800_09585 [Flavipsychrobacter sp.]